MHTTRNMIQKLQGKVIRVLDKYPAARDSDTLLVALIWDEELGGPTETHKLSAYHLLSKISRGELPNYRSISRCRSKVEEYRVDLRGKNYESRQRHQAIVKDEIINWEDAEQSAIFEGEV